MGPSGFIIQDLGKPYQALAWEGGPLDVQDDDARGTLFSPTDVMRLDL